MATSNTLVLGGLGANKFGSTTDDQVVIGATSRNDAEANTVLYVNGTTHINGKLYTTDSHITARMQINTGLPNGLHFGGNTENLDTTSIYRFNQASDQTYLRVRLSDNNQGFGTSFSDEFQIGYQDSGYTPTFRVAGSGDVISSASITATAFNTSSDRRLKNNLQMQDADALLNKLSSLSAYSYDYVGQRDLGRRIGVIAQDMLPLFPEAVNVRPDGFYAVDYGALGALAAAGVGRLNDRVVELDKAFKESGAAQTVARIDTLEGTVTEHGQRIGALESWKLSAEMQLTKTDERLGTLETWRTAATEKMDTMQNAIDLNIQKIADHAIAIQANTVAIERLDDALFTLDGRVKNNSDLINNINARWAQNFNASEDGSVLTVNAVELKVSNFTAQNMRASTVYSQRLEAEMARIAELEVNSLRTNSAVANTVQAEQLNTGSTQVYAGVGMPAVLFSAKSDGHYTVNTSALDGSYATATVIVNAGQAKVIGGQNEGIELYAEGNTIKALAAGKSIKASWIKTG
jgi:trimeric autotransporter adhesin